MYVSPTTIVSNIASLANKSKPTTREIVSKVAYLLGVSQNIFLNEYEAPRIDIYNELSQNRHARIVRNLSRLRTAIEQHFGKIRRALQTDIRSVYSLPEWIPQECFDELASDGVALYKPNYSLPQYVVAINKLLTDRINNCKDLFPLWLNWTYVRGIFIMPGGLTEEGAKAAISVYYEHMQSYPYQVYLNWEPEEKGNILYSDGKFIRMLYQWHNDEFLDESKLTDANDETKYGIYDFLEGSTKTVIVVDCENMDPFRFCAMLRGMSVESRRKIQKVILYDDVHSSSAWSLLAAYVDVPVERILIERVKESKSLVDIRLCTGVCKEFYTNDVDAFVIASSDSDYWALISSLPEARFLVMVEHEKCGTDIKNALKGAGIFYCYVDEFYSGNSDDFKKGALLKEASRYVNDAIKLNVIEMMDTICQIIRVDLSSAEKRQFLEKHIKSMRLVVEEDGAAKIELKR